MTCSTWDGARAVRCTSSTVTERASSRTSSCAKSVPARTKGVRKPATMAARRVLAATIPPQSTERLVEGQRNARADAVQHLVADAHPTVYELRAPGAARGTRPAANAPRGATSTFG